MRLHPHSLFPLSVRTLCSRPLVTPQVFPREAALSPEAEGLIRSLVCAREERLGQSGAREIQAHPS